MGDWLCMVGTTRSLVLYYMSFPGFTGFFVLDTGSFLGDTMILGADFAVFHILLEFITSVHSGNEMTGPGVGWRSAEGVALKIQPPRTTWFQPGPKLSCSAVGSAWFTFGATEGLRASPPYCVQEASA